MKSNDVCYFCMKPSNPDFLCRGCGKHVCDDCDQTGAMGHGHSVGAHRIDGSSNPFQKRPKAPEAKP